jgi:hypothetical protein
LAVIDYFLSNKRDDWKRITGSGTTSKSKNDTTKRVFIYLYNQGRGEHEVNESLNTGEMRRSLGGRWRGAR